MSNNAEYQAVPTATTGTNNRRPISSGAFFIAFLCFGLSIPPIVFGLLEYNKINNFNTEPSYCRVNSIGTKRLNEARISSVSAVWNVDIVKQPKDLVVLRSNLKTIGDGDYKFLKQALEDSEKQYSVGKVYPCYVHKKVLTSAINDKEIDDLKFAVQWQKPAQKVSIILLSIGIVLIAIAIIIPIIGLIFYLRQ